MIRIFLTLFPLLWLAACSQAPAPTVDRAPTAQAQRVAGPGEYQVKRGETLYRIARDHGMTVQELAALNAIEDPSVLREGQILRLKSAGDKPAVAGETVATPVGVGSAVETRSLDAPVASAPAVPGGAIKAPKGGKEPYSDEAYARLNKSDATPAVTPATAPPAPPTAATPPLTTRADTAAVEGVTWAWPTAAAVKSTWGQAGNKGYDFAGKQGDPVAASGDGRVLYVGEALAGYGKLVIVKHSTDLLSVYAHNSKVLVKQGQNVKRGQKIAEMGSTGTDSVKLHFEIRKQGKPVDPAPYLPRR